MYSDIEKVQSLSGVKDLLLKKKFYFACSQVVARETAVCLIS